MINRLILSCILAMTMAGAIECTSASSSSPSKSISAQLAANNRRMWEALQESDTNTLLTLFGYSAQEVNGKLVMVRQENAVLRADINAKMGGKTPLLWAVDNNTSIIPLLMTLGADPNAQNLDLTETALTRAVTIEHERLIRFLLWHKADPNIAPVSAPLSIAVTFENPTIVKILAPVTNETVLWDQLEYAKAVGSIDIQRVLEKALTENAEKRNKATLVEGIKKLLPSK